MKALIATVALLIFVSASSAQGIGGGNFGASKKNEAPAERKRPAPAAKVKSYPFHGELDSVAVDGLSLKLKGKARLRSIVLVPETRIFRGEARAVIKDAVPGERITGTVHRNDQGNEQAVTVRLGGRQAKSQE